MDINKIRIKYTAAFCSIAIFFVVLLTMNYLLVAKTQTGLSLLGQTFNPAISAVLNADRDLYQAKEAELKALLKYGNANSAKYYQDYQENVQQAYDRMHSYKNFMAQYPQAQQKIAQFEGAFLQWKTESQKVFDALNNQDLALATSQSIGASSSSFKQLRSFYNEAGETADEISATTSLQITASVDKGLIWVTVISALVVLMTFLAGIIAPKTMADALEDLSHKIRGLNNGDGDLTKRINSKRKDEIGDLAHEFDQLIEGLASLIQSIVGQSNQVVQGIGEVTLGAQQIQKTSCGQLKSVETIVFAVNELSDAIAGVAQNAQQTSDELSQVNQLTSEGSEITRTAVTEIAGLSQTVNQAASVISKLSENSKDISSVLDVIRGIAEQTNLLALNAAIEAARAGEQGRGFAVVADEVRSLASKTQQSTQSIQTMIETLQQGVEEAVSSIAKGNEATQTSVELSKQTLNALDKISAASHRLATTASQTAEATDEQSKVAADISQNLSLLCDQTNENLQVAELNSKHAQSTSQLANTLTSSVARFKLS
ncbi:methyl-accepting chemotaxis protein [Pseudoalteromonas tunicata]|uniref:Probable chemotaxis transducer n=1 Tax=Pseudoalteromonas tunicata D2 TaxID=87626 RepID=A4C6L4_9GAMM|nr:methyl-accepting chemotaxis protein [Pseudoalteromonas tunicata]ATC95592.1 methyl-accepting chemotaxis protein [Pseudoalteromonas tunicata]AXT31162.1 methyl-accepting chemotaxis protein [Pseudoalteromonas tunicata]EAR29618.1 probable chemotaxis transducer [Pseudoalteromonas tunicata D2]